MNLLLKSLYKISNNNLAGPGTISLDMLDKTYDYYREMQDLSIYSFQKNLKGDWQLIELQGEFDNFQDSLKWTMLETRRIWKHMRPSNILYTDPDTLCVFPSEIFGKFLEFRMFNNQSIIDHQQHFNCGVRYFPDVLDNKFWDQIDGMIDTWDMSKYDSEQKIYHSMMWSQDSMPVNISQAWVVKQGPFVDLNHMKDTHKKPRSIMHFHSSKNPKKTLDLMKEVWDWTLQENNICSY